MNEIFGTFSYNPLDHGIDAFHSFLMKHPKCEKFYTEEASIQYSKNVWEVLLKGFRMAEDTHFTQARKNNGAPYITHPIEMILEYIDHNKIKDIHHRDILVLALHDVIEEHPERWREVLDTFGLDIFRDVLVLSTGGFSFDIRKEIIHYFLDTYHDFLTVGHIHEEPDEVQEEQNLVGEIFRILNPAGPLSKNAKESQYKKGSVEFQKIRNAIRFYTKEILRKKKKLSDEDILKNGEYIGLGNYIYFTPIDAIRKLQDMLHNMRDMEAMEKNKKGYIQTRRIKAYILSAILRNFSMFDELSLLQKAFHKVNMQIPLDGEVYEEIKSLNAIILSEKPTVSVRASIGGEQKSGTDSQSEE